MKHFPVEFVNCGVGFVDGSKIIAAIPLENMTRLYLDCPSEIPEESGVLIFEVHDTPEDVLRYIDNCEKFNNSRR